MPNHVITTITAPKEVLDALIRQRTPEELAEANAHREEIIANARARGSDYLPDEIDAEEWLVDFNLIVACDETKVFQGSCNMQHPHPKEDGSGFYEDCWYSWNVEHWGTKWNGYSFDFLGERTMKFETAWSHPYPVLDALSKRFPNYEIDVKYADEDLGANCAHYTIVGGERTAAEDDPVEGTEDATQWAAELWGYDWEEILRDRQEYADEAPAAPQVQTVEVKDGLL